MSNGTNAKQPSPDLKRRRFLQTSLTGGVAAVTVGAVQPALATQVDGECGPISKSEWLVVALALLSRVTTDAYEKILVQVQGELTTYQKAFDELYCLLN